MNNINNINNTQDNTNYNYTHNVLTSGDCKIGPIDVVTSTFSSWGIFLTQEFKDKLEVLIKTLLMKKVKPSILHNEIIRFIEKNVRY